MGLQDQLNAAQAVVKAKNAEIAALKAEVHSLNFEIPAIFPKNCLVIENRLFSSFELRHEIRIRIFRVLIFSEGGEDGRSPDNVREEMLGFAGNKEAAKAIMIVRMYSYLCRNHFNI